ncbi:MAG: hypothetical protein QM640_16285 [Niabella sp.]
MKFDDSLWKGILEDLFADFLRFFFSNADKVFDIKKGFEYLDKEMAQIATEAYPESPKYVDKLVKVFTSDGREQWVLVHVEVQGYTDKHFEERMFTYYYRIFDRYRQRITAVALLTDRDKKFYPTAYQSEFLGTEIFYRFNSYKIMEQEENALLQNPNPFAFVILTVLLALRRGRLSDRDLLSLKLELVRRLLEQRFSKSTIKGIFYFIRNYVVFADPEIGSKFDNEIDFIIQKSRHMGIVEMIKEREHIKLIEKGKTEVVRNLITKLGLSDAQVADVAEVPVAFVKKVRASLKKSKG